MRCFQLAEQLTQYFRTKLHPGMSLLFREDGSIDSLYTVFRLLCAALWFLGNGIRLEDEQCQFGTDLSA